MTQKPLLTLYAVVLSALSISPAHASLKRGRMLDILRESQRHCVQESLSGHEVLESFESSPRQGGLETLRKPSTLELQTDRFQLRALTVEDAPQVDPILTDPKVGEMSGDYLDPYTVRSILSMGSQSATSFPRGTIINFGIFENGTLIGMTQVCNTSPDHALQKGIAKPGETWAEISYHLAPAHWGKGVATEVARATTQFAFQTLKVDGIHAQTILQNDGSGKVLMNVGMSRIETMRFASVSGTDGSHFYAATKAEYDAAKAKRAAAKPRLVTAEPNPGATVAALIDQPLAAYYPDTPKVQARARKFLFERVLTDHLFYQDPAKYLKDWIARRGDSEEILAEDSPRVVLSLIQNDGNLLKLRDQARQLDLVPPAGVKPLSASWNDAATPGQ